MPLNGRFPFPDINFTVATTRTRSLLGYVDLQLNPRVDLSSALECIVVVDRGEEEARFENRVRDSAVSLRTRNQTHLPSSSRARRTSDGGKKSR